MFRRTRAILDNSSGQEELALAAIDADLIMTAVTLGFCASRFAVGQPVEFSADPRKKGELDELRQAVECLQNALGLSAYGGKITAAHAPDFGTGAVITGSSGGARTPFAQRHPAMMKEAAAALKELALASPGDVNPDGIGYQGRGAYTGFVSDPINDLGNITATRRQNIPAGGPGERWVPPAYTNDFLNKSGAPAGQEDSPWGLIGRKKAIGFNMAEEPFGQGDHLVGYTHGMVQAIYRAVSLGPWCTPYELLVGTETTKVASCLACTLFMYAAGFPPSNIHLGRGESWTPLAARSPGDKGYSLFDETLRSINLRWSLECAQQIGLGARILASSDAVSERHLDRLPLVAGFLSAHGNDPYAGGNLVLDALTVHQSETKRITTTLKAP